MRTLVDIPDADVEALDGLARTRPMSRAALIRKAVNMLLRRKGALAAEDAFGLWGDDRVDGAAYQDAIRREW